MKLTDITRSAQEAPLYPGASPMLVERVCDMKKGIPYNVSMITTGSHIGTHADAFNHFLKESDVGIDQMGLSHYYGPCRVLTVPEATPITRATLEGRINSCKRLVLHTGGQSYMTKDAAAYIVENGISTVVTDAWSIAPLDNEIEIHKILLSSNVAVVENVILDGIKDGEYTLSAFPIKIAGCDGAPVRAVLIGED